MEGLGFRLRSEAQLSTLTADVVKSSEIEGEKLNAEELRSSIARRLGLECAGAAVAGRNVEGIVEMMLDAAQNCAHPLTAERLYGWHAALFPTGRSGMQKISLLLAVDHLLGWRVDLHLRLPASPLAGL